MIQTVKPIIFSTPMVQAILAGRKTQTRRVIKPQPTGKPCRCGYTPGGWAVESEPDEYGAIGCQCDHKCTPRYDVGDILWVREMWGRSDAIGNEFGYMYKVYGEDCGHIEVSGMTGCWKSPLYMPREAARLFLRVTGVRAERLNDIEHNSNDVMAEGGFHNLSQFKEIWDTLNAKRGYGWNKSPWVWVYQFDRAVTQCD